MHLEFTVCIHDMDECCSIVAWLCDIYLSLLICFGNYDMFLIMQLNLTCRSFQRTSNDSSEEEPEASWFKDTMAKERGLRHTLVM